MTGTDPAYQASGNGALEVPKQLYDAIAAAPRKLRARFDIPIRSGRAWEVPAGSLCRIIAFQGPQVGDLNIWNRSDPRERLWAAKTRQLQAAHVTTYDRLWSTLPFLRPLVTITAETRRAQRLSGHGIEPR